MHKAYTSHPVASSLGGRPPGGRAGQRAISDWEPAVYDDLPFHALGQICSSKLCREGFRPPGDAGQSHPRLFHGASTAIARLFTSYCMALARRLYGSTAPQTSVVSLCIAAAERRESPPPPPSRLVATTGWRLTRRPFGGPVPPPSAMPPVNAPNSHGSILPVSKVGDQTQGKGHHPAEQDFFDGVIEFCHNLGLTHLWPGLGCCWLPP